MRFQIKNKQPNSKMCLVCGLKNLAGMHSAFYELVNGELLGLFTPRQEHQSYPGRLHGGIISAILDETMGRAIMIAYAENFWGVTMEIKVRFKKPVPLDKELRVVGRITRDTNRFFEGTGELLLPDNSIAAEGQGKYLKLPLAQIADFNREEQEWRVVPLPDDPDFVDL